MKAMSVTSKGQVTIPRQIRQQLGIKQASRIEFLLHGDRVELRLKNPRPPASNSGFGMLKSRRPAVPVDFDPSTLLKR